MITSGRDRLENTTDRSVMPASISAVSPFLQAARRCALDDAPRH
jgi:hypothetical protein